MPTNFTKSWESKPGISYVPAYQSSGRPWASGSIDAASGYVQLEFPYVTRWVQVSNHGTGSVKVGFSENGVRGANYFRVAGVVAAGTSAPQSVRLELKVSELWLHGNTDSVDVVAGITTIPATRTSGSTGSSWSGSAGVG
tara:strand:+ start:114 stop:533 length:420 start_codon:yes stop_codon:yes gene_type:complete